MKKYLSAGVLAVGLWCAGSVHAVPTPIDLNTWSQEGPGGNGNWTVQGGGDSVFQSINGNPTMFVSPNQLFNTNIVGSFGVETGGDNDYIGFVFGFGASDTDPFLLFDWKQGQQSGSAPGFTLSRVTGGASNVPFGNHQTSVFPNYDVLATNTGVGWEDNVVYDFDLLYQSNRIKIDITGGTGAFQNGATVFDINGTFASGRFGFYNFSQPSVRYQGLTEEFVPPQPRNGAVPEPITATLGLMGLGVLGMATRRRMA